MPPNLRCYAVPFPRWNLTMCANQRQGRERRPGPTRPMHHQRGQRKTWYAPINIEPANGPEALCLIALCIPDTGVDLFYSYDSESVLHKHADKYSGDHGRVGPRSGGPASAFLRRWDGDPGTREGTANLESGCTSCSL